MNTITLTQKQKNKHLQFQHYEYICNELTKFNALNKDKKRNIGKELL